MKNKTNVQQVLKTGMIVIGAVVFSTVAIQATDVLRGIDTPLGALVNGSDTGCPVGTVPFLLGARSLCVDAYEASPAASCPHQLPGSELDTSANVAIGDCMAVSEERKEPWRYVTLTQAQQLCARAGKRLPTNEEWYAFVLGMGEVGMCNISSKSNEPVPTGVSQCVSPAGIHDLVGNVWEWINETITDGQYAGRSLPESGYVGLVDAAGVVVETSNEPQSDFGDDYAWVNQAGVRGMVRGGFYGSGEDAGLFAQNLSIAPNFAAAGIGFRCVQDR